MLVGLLRPLRAAYGTLSARSEPLGQLRDSAEALEADARWDGMSGGEDVTAGFLENGHYLLHFTRSPTPSCR